MHVLYDTIKDDKKNKILNYLKTKNIKISYIKGRPTFNYCFTLANEQYANSKVIISNADIYFNNTLYLLSDYNLNNKFIALTRWNVTPTGSLKIFKQFDKNGNFRADWTYYSQDAWIFQTPIQKFNYDAIALGTLYCDGMIAYQADQVGLNVFNPCYSIQCCHLHLSEVRNYARPSYPPYPMKPLPWISLNKVLNNFVDESDKYVIHDSEYQYLKMYYNEKK